MSITEFPYNRLVMLENFGHSMRAPAYLYRPGNVEEIGQLFHFAAQNGLAVCLRGAGRSYNDAALNGGGIVLDCQRMNRFLDWDPATGLVRCEPGVTIRQLWERLLPDGWWPPVVPGTMFPTLGGCLAANVHGKNNFRLGPIGEHVVQFTALLPSGAEVTCLPNKNGDLFRAMIGGLGLLGVFTSITLQMRKIYSGLLNVQSWPARNLEEHLATMLEAAPRHDHTVGWLDATAGGGGLGRGQLHTADDLAEGEDPNPQQTLNLTSQALPERFLGLIPRSLLWRYTAPFVNDPGARLVNSVKYFSSLHNSSYRQSQAAFHFLLDSIPNWEWSYGRGGLIQYQSILPKETALDAWSEMLTLARRRGLPAYLGVTKRHRPDSFLLTHALDGFSLALDFKVTERKRRHLSVLLQDFDRIVLDAGGRFYMVKNSETTSETARRFLGEGTVDKFRALKKRCDPHRLLESDLFRRLFGE